MSIATSAVEGAVEAFALQNLEMAGIVAEGPNGVRVPQVCLALVGITTMVDVGPKTYLTYLSPALAEQLGGPFAAAAAEAIADAGTDAPAKMPGGMVLASPADARVVAAQADAVAAKLRAP